MSASKWRYTEECDGQPCPGDCDTCNFDAMAHLRGELEHYKAKVRMLEHIAEINHDTIVKQHQIFKLHEAELDKLRAERSEP